MKKVFLLLCLLFFTVTMQSKIKIDRIDPTDWFVGMKNSSLQLMVYGKNIKGGKVSTSYAGVKVDSVVNLDSPNYLLVYLNIKNAKAGEMVLSFSLNGSSEKIKYHLKDRCMKGDEHIGFDNSDVLYMLMPDRFANGKPDNDMVKGMRDQLVDRSAPSLRHGGDLEGIRRHLDYFNQLGATALWLTPVLENDRPADEGKFSTYHGYATTDYYRVDPRFGSNEDFANLVKESHAHGLKVVMDMIFNHCGDYHPWNIDIPSKDWFNSPHYGMQTSYKLTPVVDPYASKIDKKETTEGWFVSSMPDLNQSNPYVIKYLIQNSEWWIETVDIDGIRMDTYPYADSDAMAEWMKTIDTEYPNFNTVGETWVTEPAYTAAWQKDSKLSSKNSYLKTVMDFSFYDKLNMAKKEDTDEWWNGLNRIYNSLAYDYLYTNPSSVMAFIENHDTDRFLEEGKDTLNLKQAYALLLTMNRIPQLYYGTEVLMNGTKKITDGDVRKDFPGGFPGDKHDCFTKEGRDNEENAMFDWTSKLLHWRMNNLLISKGKQTQFVPWKGVYVITRQYDGKTCMTILNGKSSASKLDIKRYAEIIGNNKTAVDVITGNKISIDKDIELSPKETLIIEF